jgi:Zn-dependent protease/predicted transcriptional regulator
MRWSWRIARIAGIDVHVHATFLLLLAFYTVPAYQRGGSAAAATALATILLLFAIVTMHEYGHALAARHYGIPTRDITLLPIGGVARLERMPREPRHELVIALAGPAVNVVLAALLYAGLRLTGGVPDEIAPADERFFSRTLLQQLLAWNVMLAGFNMIPAFPLDGGRVLRAALAWRGGDYAAATRRAAQIGRFIAVVLGLAGYFYFRTPMLVVIALFIWFAAAAEAGAVQEQSPLADVPLGEVMVTDVRTLAPGDPLSRAVELILAGFQQDFPVVEDGAVVGVLGRRDLLRVLAERGEGASVGTSMRRDFERATLDDPVDAALARLQACGCHAIPVVRGRQLVGMLTVDNVGEYVMIKSALRRQSGNGVAT